MATKRTLRGWFEFLDDDKREFTLEEFVALMSFNQREYARVTMEHARELTQAIGHVESMLTTLDSVMALRDSLYGELGAKRGQITSALEGARRNGSDST